MSNRDVESRGAVAMSNRDVESRGAVANSNTMLVGSSAPLRRVRRTLSRLRESDLNVLIWGETGTGKTLAAESLTEVTVHWGESIGRRDGPDSLPSEARCLLDDLGQLSTTAQDQLIRWLDTQKAPVVATFASDPLVAVADGRLRAELFYRLAPVELQMPALRTRLDDIPDLCGHLLQRMGSSATLTDAQLAPLAEHHWPGNVRELDNALRASLALHGDLKHLHIRLAPLRIEPTTLRDAEAAHIRSVLETVGWNKTRAAQVLGIQRSTVYQKIKEHRLEAS